MLEFRAGPVFLRVLEREHCRALWAADETDTTQPTEHTRPGLAPENADKWFEEIQGKQGQSGVDLGVFDLEGNIKGHVQLHGIDWQDRSVEIGIGFAKKSDRGRGYGTSALRLVVGYGFDHLGLHRIAANTLSSNKAAVRLFEKCGFVPEGRQREAFLFGGRWYDRVCYSMLETEFRNTP